MQVDAGVRRSMGVHWGTFNLTDEPLDEPPRALASALKGQGLGPDNFVLLVVGETRRVPRQPNPEHHDTTPAPAPATPRGPG